MTAGAGMTEIRPGYKQTEVGVIPEDWDVIKLNKVASIRNLRQYPQNVAPETPCVELEHIGQGTGELVGQTTAEFSKSMKFSFRRGDVLFGRLRAYLRKYWQAQFDGLCTTEIWPLISNERLDSGYLYCLVQTERFAATASISYGTHMPRTDWKIVGDLPIPLPPLAEQRAIAAALSDVDGLLTALAELIAKKRAIKQAAMQQLLTGQTRLPGFEQKPGYKQTEVGVIPEDWDTLALGEVLNRISNGAVYQLANQYSGIPITRIETISDSVVDLSRVGYATKLPYLSKYRMQQGDILFSHINSLEHIGKVAFWESDIELYHGMNLLLLRTNSMAHNRYVYYWLGSNYGRSKTATLAKQAVNQASINTSELKQIKIPLPTLPEQAAIVAILFDLDSEIDALEAQRAKVQAIKQGMLQELLTGRTRLV